MIIYWIDISNDNVDFFNINLLVKYIELLFVHIKRAIFNRFRKFKLITCRMHINWWFFSRIMKAVDNYVHSLQFELELNVRQIVLYARN